MAYRLARALSATATGVLQTLKNLGERMYLFPTKQLLNFSIRISFLMRFGIEIQITTCTVIWLIDGTFGIILTLPGCLWGCRATHRSGVRRLYATAPRRRRERGEPAGREQCPTLVSFLRLNTVSRVRACFVSCPLRFIYFFKIDTLNTHKWTRRRRRQPIRWCYFPW